MSFEIGDLSKLKFPDSIKQGLNKLEEILRLPSSPPLHKIQQQIIEEHIFNLQESPSNQKNVGPLEEMMMVRAIAQHLAQIIEPGLRNSVFITLFPAVSNDHRPLRILTSLVSLAVVTHNVAVLDATSVWMQQVGCLSIRCGQVCRTLIQDFFQKKESSPLHFSRAIKALPSATPLFTANLITTLAQVYANLGTNEFCTRPPDYLVKIFILWLKMNPLLGLAPLTTPLLGISLPMVAIPPIAPLTKWCVEAPFLCPFATQEDDIFLENFSELHLLLLQTIQNVASVRSQMTQREVICAEHLKNICEVLIARIGTTKEISSDERSLKRNTIAIDRLAQITLVALHTECLSGRMSEMWLALKKIPISTRLMRMLLNFNPCQ